MALDAADRRHHPERLARRLQHRPLLDMALDIAEHGLRVAGETGDGVGVEAEATERVAEPEAVGIFHVEHGGVEGAGECPRSDQGRRKPHALFVGEGKHFDREGQRHARVAQNLQSKDRQHDAHDPVIGPARADAVLVRAQEQHRRARRAVAAADQGSCCVKTDREPGRFHLRGQFGERGAVRGGERQAGHAGTGRGAGGKRREARGRARGEVSRHRCSPGCRGKAPVPPRRRNRRWWRAQ